MKKSILAFLVLLFIAGAVYSEATQSPYYVRTMKIVSVFSHKDGYKIIYRNAKMEYSAFYVPITWFGTASSKAEIVYGEGDTYPYFSVFWKDGEFDHIRLYLNKNIRHRSRGDLGVNTDDLSSKFEGVETIKLNL
ncbi:MAG: hypothetical protein PQJ46_06910 [Spirochaetales bacterium]|nr:hypothetical protein [Spirochaetales bacterium]